MTEALYAGAAAVFLAACVVYFRGHFRGAGLLGLIYAGLVGTVVARSMGPVGATAALVLLCLAPAIFLGIHIVDARRGIFLLPTIYSIPIAFLCGALLWIIAGLGILF